METESYTNNSHLGRKIERIRRLRGMTQTDLGELLGVTKQAISKMEQSEKIDDDKLKQVADALGVTEDGLKKFTEETVLYSTNNFYENCHVSASNIGPITHVENLNHFSMEQAVKLFEELLKIEREKYRCCQSGDVHPPWIHPPFSVPLSDSVFPYPPRYATRIPVPVPGRQPSSVGAHRNP